MQVGPLHSTPVTVMERLSRVGFAVERRNSGAFVLLAELLRGADDALRLDWLPTPGAGLGEGVFGAPESTAAEARAHERYLQAVRFVGQGRMREVEETLAPLLEAPVQDLPLGLEARVINLRGVVQRHSGELPGAYDSFRRAERCFSRLGDTLGVGRTLINQADIHGDLGDYASAAVLHEHALEYLSASTHPELYARVLLSIAYDRGALEDFDGALEFTERAASMLEGREVSARFVAVKGIIIGSIHLDRGRCDDSFQSFTQAIPAARASGDRLALGHALVGLGRTHMLEAMHAKASACFMEAEAVFEDAGSVSAQLNLLLVRAESLLAERRSEEARTMLANALERASRLGNTEFGCRAHGLMSQVAEAADDLKGALGHHRESFALHVRGCVDRALCQMNVLRLRLESLEERQAHAVAKIQYEQLERQNTALAVSNTDLEQLVEERRRLLALVAHDLRSPLSTVITTADLARTDRNLSGPELKGLLQGLGETASHALSLLDRLLSIERMETGGVESEPESIVVDRLIRTVVSAHSAAARQKKIEIHANIRPPGLHLYSDPELVRQALDNLLSNAIKYSPHGRKVYVDAKATKGNRVEFTVADEGPGISAEDGRRLFTRFHRTENLPTGGEPSTGLGLYLVRGYARMLGGDVTFSPRSPRGSIFSLQIPAGEDDLGTG